MKYSKIKKLNEELKKNQYTEIDTADFQDKEILNSIVLEFHDKIIPLYNKYGETMFTEDSTTEHYYANYYVDLFHKLYYHKSMIPKETEKLVSDSNNLLLEEGTMNDNNKFAVFLESHQNKHQSLAIGKLMTYTGAPGNKFPQQCNIEWHKNNTCPVVLEMLQNACQENCLSETNRLYIPKKEPINNIIYDVAFCYDPTRKQYFAWYHCYPTSHFRI